MKNLTRTITLFVVFGLTTSGYVLAQAVETPAQPLPAPAPPSPPKVEPFEEVMSKIETLTNYPRSFVGKYTSRHNGSGPVLVIPSSQMKVENLAAIIQDFNVMSRLLERNLQRANIATEGGNFLFSGSSGFFSTGFFPGGQQTTQTMYLQGYGALFLMKVDFPLSAPLQVEEEKETKEEETDPVWERTKREMYEPEEVRRRRADQPEQKYDTEKVENLKTILVKTLKHAANIRILKPDESVILAVTGSGESAGGITAIATTKIVGHEDHNTRIVEELAPRGSSPTMLVIRAKKSDIDGFAKADLDLDQFRQRTQILTCPYFDGGARRGDLFGDYFRKGRR